MVYKKLYKSFKFAFEGVAYCISNERNFRIHITVAAIIYLLSPYYKFTPAEMIMLTLVIAVVILAEMVNTSIETIVDMITDEFHTLAKKAKDVAAGAVLIATLCAIMCALFLILRPTIMLFIINDVFRSPVKIVISLLVIILSYLFVKGNDKKNV